MSRESLLIILLVPLLVFSIPARSASEAQPPPVNHLSQWGAITLFHGLPSDRVRAIAQDSDGALWFGTDNGLARYDGRRTQTISSRSLPAPAVLALKFDPSGALWIGTENGAARLAAGQDPRALPETAGQAITAIIETGDGRVLLASRAGVIFNCRATPDSACAIQTRARPSAGAADKAPPPAVTSLAEVNGALYAGTLGRGLVQIEGDATREVPMRQRAYFIEALESGDRGGLWFGARASTDQSGLFAVEAGNVSRISGPAGTVTALRAGTDGDVWVGTAGRGVFRCRGKEVLDRFTFDGTGGGLRSDQIFSIFVDREQVVWFGTDRGVCRYDPHALYAETISTEAESNFVRSVFRSASGQLLCGTNEGLFGRDAGGVWQEVAGLGLPAVYALAEDQHGRLLVGTSAGLFVRNDWRPDIWRTASFTRIKPPGSFASSESDSVRAIAAFHGEMFIASYGRGLERFGNAELSSVWPSPAADPAMRETVCLHAGPDGMLWIGTAHAGAFIFDGKEVREPPGLGALKESPIWAITHSGDGALWFATSRGLYRFRDNALALLIPDVDARSVLAAGPESPSGVWCATAASGVYRARLDERFGVVTARLDAEQGLPSQGVFALFHARDSGSSEILIGTSRGLARYTPGAVAPVLTPARIISRRIHQPEELRSGLLLEYPQNSLVLDVAAISSRTFPEQFQYSFVLYDNGRRAIRQEFSHDAQFSMEGLRPGRYRVEARGYTFDLVPSAPLAFDLTVTGAPFPRTTVALSILLLLALVVLAWGYRQNRRIARTGAALEVANHELAGARMQLAAEAERERHRIARDLHDQTLADLRRLVLMVDEIPPATSGNGDNNSLPAQFRGEIEGVSSEIRRICEDLSPSVLENLGLGPALEWALSNGVAHSPADCRFTYEVACDDHLEEHAHFAPGVRIQIYRIAQEAVNNICRHAGASHVRLSARTTPDGGFLMTIEDDGRDFDPHDKRASHGRGLASIRARASLIEAEVSWHKGPGGGMVFELRKPAATSVYSET